MTKRQLLDERNGRRTRHRGVCSWWLLTLTLLLGLGDLLVRNDDDGFGFGGGAIVVMAWIHLPSSLSFHHHLSPRGGAFSKLGRHPHHDESPSRSHSSVGLFLSPLPKYTSSSSSSSSSSTRLWEKTTPQSQEDATTTKEKKNNDDRVDKGFNVLETLFGATIPQGPLVATVKGGYNLLWRRLMAELAPQTSDGGYARPSYNLRRGWIGDTSSFPDEAGRYHVYLGNPCPWCHRVRLVLNVLQIDEDALSTTALVDDPTRASRGGWICDPYDPDPLFTAPDLRNIYDELSILDSGESFRGRCTAPLLVDKKTKRIVSNESSDIVRMIHQAQLGRDVDHDNSDDEGGGGGGWVVDLYPEELRNDIDDTNGWVYDLINNGVYQCGFATTQRAYADASDKVRRGLKRADAILETRRFLCSDTIFTEADLRLLPTMVRYDGAYRPLFRAGGVHTSLPVHYPALYRWLRRCWQEIPGVSDSIDIPQACGSYYQQLFPLNPSGIIPSPPPTAESLGLTTSIE